MTDAMPDGELYAERTPPHDMLAEQCVLGSMLLTQDAIAEVIDLLDPEDFYRPAHATLFALIRDLYAAGDPVDVVTLNAELINTGQVSQVNGLYLHTLIAAVLTAANVDYYANIVRRRAVMRRMVEAGVRVTQMGYGADRVDGDVDDLLGEAQRVFDTVAGHRAADDYVILQTALQATLDEVDAIQTAGSKAWGVPTGLDDLDDLLNGLHDGQLIIVAGRPGLGKSTLATDFLRSASIRHNMTSAMFSLEMGRAEITMRILAAEGRIPLDKLRGGGMTDDHWTKLVRASSQIAEAPLFIDDSPNLSLTAIRSKARRLKQKHNLRLLVVDYLQLMSTGMRVENRQQEVSAMSRSLKLLAKDLQVPVVAVSQLNRGPEQRHDKRPQMSDLRESGSLEQDADVVILMHREDYYEKESVRAGYADLIVAKHRNGATRDVEVMAQLHWSRFVNAVQGT